MTPSEQNNYPLKSFYSKIYKRYDLVNRLFTLGQDKKWRRAAASECVKDKNRMILDLCCGTGDLLIEILKKAPDDTEINGFDFNKNMLSVAQKKINRRKSTSKITLMAGYADNLPFQDKQFDSIGIAFGFRNLTYKNSQRHAHISEIYRVLKKGGELVILESSKPKSRIMLLFFTLYVYIFLVLIGSILSGSFKAYWYLAKSSKEYYSYNELKTLLEDYGFEIVKNKEFLFGAASLNVAVKKT